MAANLLSQAEHDPNAGSVLITDSPALADAVDAALERRTGATRHAGRVRAALTGPQSGAVLVRDADQGLAVADAYAAEHLEIHTADAPALARRVRNAGAIFVDPYSPMPLGDYLAGSNHVLPTGGTARFASGLSIIIIDHGLVVNRQQLFTDGQGQRVQPRSSSSGQDDSLSYHDGPLMPRRFS